MVKYDVNELSKVNEKIRFCSSNNTKLKLYVLETINLSVKIVFA